METSTSSANARLQMPTALISSLTAMAAISAMGGVLAAMVELVASRIAGSFDLGVAVRMVGWLISGAAFGAALWALSCLVKRQYESELAVQQVLAAMEQLLADQARIANDADMPARIMDQLAQINANVLLSDAQRHAKRSQEQLQVARQLSTQIESALALRKFAQAQGLLERLEAQAPDYVGLKDLRDRAEFIRNASRQSDIEMTEAKVKEQMAAASFEAAEDTAKQLQARYPDSSEASALVETVSREAQAFHAEHRRRMYREIGSSAEARRWRSAVGAAQKFLEAYPDGPEADLVQAQLPTMRDNAHLEEVRQMRDEIRDLINRRRFVAALELARDVVVRFPRTAAADELRQGMSKLEEMARKAAK